MQPRYMYFLKLFFSDNIGEADTYRPRHAVQCRTLSVKSEYFGVIKNMVVLAVATDIFGSIRC